MPYNINGQQVDLGEEPVEKDGRNFVPLEEVVGALGGTVSWNDAEKTAQASIGQWKANIQMANPTVNVAGQNGTSTNVQLSDPPYVEDGKLYVPWTFFGSAFGYKTNMEGDTLYVHL